MYDIGVYYDRILLVGFRRLVRTFVERSFKVPLTGNADFLGIALFTANGRAGGGCGAGCWELEEDEVEEASEFARGRERSVIVLSRSSTSLKPSSVSSCSEADTTSSVSDSYASGIGGGSLGLGER